MFKVCGVFKVYEQENNGISTEVEAILKKIYKFNKHL